MKGVVRETQTKSVCGKGKLPQTEVDKFLIKELFGD